MSRAILCALALLPWLIGPSPVLGDSSAIASAPPERTAQSARIAAPVAVEGLANTGFECSYGYGPQAGITGNVPGGWTALLLNGNPTFNSARLQYSSSQTCDNQDWVEHLEAQDALVIRAEDLYATGKAFDALVYQQAAVTPGQQYSLSGWMVSLCGGSAQPSDCPPGYYMAKMLGLDPGGGTQPLGTNVAWTEDRRNFNEMPAGEHWVNLRLAATAEAGAATVFARINSPQPHHDNHAFIDAVMLIRAPSVTLTVVPDSVFGRRVTLSWTGAQSPDIGALVTGTYELYFDLQYRASGESEWHDWLTRQAAGAAAFSAPGPGSAAAYSFRARAWTEQPSTDPWYGTWPPYRFDGVWSAEQIVTFPALPERQYLAAIQR